MITIRTEGIGILPAAWGSWQRHGDHAEDMRTMPKAWGSCKISKKMQKTQKMGAKQMNTAVGLETG